MSMLPRLFAVSLAPSLVCVLADEAPSMAPSVTPAPTVAETDMGMQARTRARARVPRLQLYLATRIPHQAGNGKARGGDGRRQDRPSASSAAGGPLPHAPHQPKVPSNA